MDNYPNLENEAHRYQMEEMHVHRQEKIRKIQINLNPQYPPIKPKPQNFFPVTSVSLSVSECVRDKVPGKIHAGWEAAAKRRDPIEILEQSNKD
jgi:hypothetical protein